MAILRIETLDGQVKDFPLRFEHVVIGRSNEVDLKVEDTQVSRRHALIQKDDAGHWQLRDLGSRNKILIDKRPVTTHVLRHGDVFTVGSVRIRFLERPTASATPSSPVAAGSPAGVLSKVKSSECPMCKAPVVPKAVLCVNCGLNLKTGRLLEGVAVKKGAPAAEDLADLPAACPCCEQALAPGARICVPCGIDVRTGRAIMTVQDTNLDSVYTTAENTIRYLSWLLPSGIYPIASEALGMRRPWAIRGIAVLTILISAWFLAVYVYSPNPDPGVRNLMLWCGSSAAYEKEVRDARKEFEKARRELKARGWKDEDINDALGRQFEEPVAGRPGRFRGYQLLTNAFLHGGILHLAGNMLFLMVLGTRVNALIGNILSVILYPLLAIAGSAAHFWSMAGEDLSPALGASGAVMGLAGMYLVLMPTPNVHMAAWWRFGLIGGFQLSLRFFAVRGFWVVLFYIAFDVVFTIVGLKDQVAHWAHLGGFVAGMILGLILLVCRLVNARGGDLLSVLLGRHAWALVGKPNRPVRTLW